MPMRDLMTEQLFRRNDGEARELNRGSDLLEILPLASPAGQRFLMVFACGGLVRGEDGHVEVAHHHVVGLSFTERHAHESPNPATLLTWLEPRRVWNPHVRAPFTCIGHVAPGTGLREIVLRVFDVITLRTVSTHDALNPAAAEWIAQHRSRIPVDPRPPLRAGFAFADDADLPESELHL